MQGSLIPGTSHQPCEVVLKIRKKEQIGEIGRVPPGKIFRNAERVVRIAQPDLQAEGAGALLESVGTVDLIRERL